MVHQALKGEIPEKHSLEIQNSDEAEVAGPSSSPEVFQCFICNLSFGRRVSLTRHYALKHFKSEIEKLSFRCTEGKSYISVYTFFFHSRLHFILSMFSTLADQ
jgi:hypothetical protein